MAAITKQSVGTEWVTRGEGRIDHREKLAQLVLTLSEEELDEIILSSAELLAQQ